MCLNPIWPGILEGAWAWEGGGGSGGAGAVMKWNLEIW